MTKAVDLIVTLSGWRPFRYRRRRYLPQLDQESVVFIDLIIGNNLASRGYRLPHHSRNPVNQKLHTRFDEPIKVITTKGEGAKQCVARMASICGSSSPTLACC